MSPIVPAYDPPATSLDVDTPGDYRSPDDRQARLADDAARLHTYLTSHSGPDGIGEIDDADLRRDLELPHRRMRPALRELRASGRLAWAASVCTYRVWPGLRAGRASSQRVLDVLVERAGPDGLVTVSHYEIAQALEWDDVGAVRAVHRLVDEDCAIDRIHRRVRYQLEAGAGR